MVTCQKLLLSFTHDPSSPSFYSNTFQNIPGIYGTLAEVHVSTKHTAVIQIKNLTNFSLNFKSNLLVIRIFLLNSAIAMANLDLISRVHLALFVISLPKYLQYPTFQVVF